MWDTSKGFRKPSACQFIGSTDKQFYHFYKQKYRHLQQPWPEIRSLFYTLCRWENVGKGGWYLAKSLQHVLLHQMALIKISLLREYMTQKTSVQDTGNISLVFYSLNSWLPKLQVENTAKSLWRCLIRLQGFYQWWITEHIFPQTLTQIFI